jgi:catechol 2,3-dioxygenase
LQAASGGGFVLTEAGRGTACYNFFMTSETLPTTTFIGAVSLTVPSLEKSREFYEKVLGFEPILSGNEIPGALTLGAGGRGLIQLVEKPGARKPRGTSGMYHVAFVLSSRRELALSLSRIASLGWDLQGVANHGVSESLYLSDADGNGIEIYHDLPRDNWPYDDRQRLNMGTDELDLDGVLGELEGLTSVGEKIDPAASIGHIHLQVSHLEDSIRFYTRVLGFDLMQRYGPAAAFVSAGRYHHHIGLNSWAGEGIASPPPGAAGLRWFSLVLPDATSIQACAARVRAAGMLLEERPEGFFGRDPSKIGYLLTTG